MFTFVINEQIVPWSNHRARNIIRESMLQDVMPEVREDVFFCKGLMVVYFMLEVMMKENLL